MHLCAGLTAASWILEPFGGIGANFPLQLSSRTQFAKIENKKVIAENQCEKHKKSSLGCIDQVSVGTKLLRLEMPLQTKQFHIQSFKAYSKTFPFSYLSFCSCWLLFWLLMIEDDFFLYWLQVRIFKSLIAMLPHYSLLDHCTDFNPILYPYIAIAFLYSKSVPEHRQSQELVPCCGARDLGRGQIVK